MIYTILLKPEDFCELTVESAAMAKVLLSGTRWIQGINDK